VVVALARGGGGGGGSGSGEGSGKGSGCGGLVCVMENTGVVGRGSCGKHAGAMGTVVVGKAAVERAVLMWERQQCNGQCCWGVACAHGP
jgi:hypothetical protein